MDNPELFFIQCSYLSWKKRCYRRNHYPIVTNMWKIYFRRSSEYITANGKECWNSSLTFSRQTLIRPDRLSCERDILSSANNRKICRVISIRDWFSRFGVPSTFPTVSSTMPPAIRTIWLMTEIGRQMHSIRFPPGKSTLTNWLLIFDEKTIQSSRLFFHIAIENVYNIIDYDLCVTLRWHFSWVENDDGWMRYRNRMFFTSSVWHLGLVVLRLFLHSITKLESRFK